MHGSVMRTVALMRKEMIQVWRDRRTLLLILFLPFLQMLLFAYAVRLTVDHIATAVADLSRDAQSQALINALTLSGYFDVKQYVADEAQVIRAMDQGLVRAGVVIPPGFAAHVERGGAQVLVLLDGSDSYTVLSGYSAAAAIVQDRAFRVWADRMRRLGVRLELVPITSTTHVLYNPDMNEMIFVLPGMAALLLQIMTINLTSISVVRERENGTIEQLLATPVRPLELLIAKTVPNIVLSALDLLIVTSAGIFLFGVPFRGNPWTFMLLSLGYIISGLGLGLLISTLAQTQRQAQQIGAVLLLLSMLLTGFIYPRQPMPAVVRAVGNLIPLTYFLRITRGIITKGVGVDLLWNDVLILAIYAVVAMSLASLAFKKRLD